MNSKLCSAALLTVLAGARLTAAAEPRAEPLLSFSTPGYTIVAPDEATARNAALHLVTVERVLGTMLKLEPRIGQAPATVILLRKAELKRYLRSGQPLREELLLDGGATYLMMRSDVSQRIFRTSAFHQGAHLFLRRHFDRPLPLWFEEGFALVAQSTRIEGGHARIGDGHFSLRNQRNADRIDRKNEPDNLPWPNEYEWIPLERLLRIGADSPEFRSRWSVPWVRRESWAMVHNGLISDPQLGRQMFAYLDAINVHPSVDDAVLASFGMKVPELERILTRYAERADYPALRIAFEPPAPPVLSRGRALDTGETVAMIGALEAGARQP
jgi:hypothetical protein